MSEPMRFPKHSDYGFFFCIPFKAVALSISYAGKRAIRMVRDGVLIPFFDGYLNF